MRILVTGAYGLIGSVCVARLIELGYDVIGCGRAIASARRRFPNARWIKADFLKLQTAQDDVERIQLAGTAALFDGCVSAGVRRLVHVSAIGAETAGPTSFSRTKAAAEAHLQKLSLDWVILRPAFIFGANVYGGSAMLRGIAAFPFIMPVFHPDAPVQIVGATDVAETIVRAVDPAMPSRVTWDVAHPQVHTLADLTITIRAWLGFSPRGVLRLPDALAGVVGAIADAIGWLGWRSPARTTSFAQLALGVVGDPAPWMAATGFMPKSLDAILAARPATVQDRWFARLYFLKPLAILGLALTVIVAGAEEFVSLRRIAAGALAVSAVLFATYVLPGLIFGATGVVLGLGPLFRLTARLALWGLLILTALQATHYCFTLFHSGYFPIAAISAIPILLASLFTLAILDDR
jgi:uncharacterized protein YbjT (DUF2867 family)